jgi:hypothetical protein
MARTGYRFPEPIRRFGQGLDDLAERLEQALERPPPEPPTWVSETRLLRLLEATAEALQAELRLMEQACREATDTVLQNAAAGQAECSPARVRLEATARRLLEPRQRLLS